MVEAYNMQASTCIMIVDLWRASARLIPMETGEIEGKIATITTLVLIEFSFKWPFSEGTRPTGAS